METQSQEKTQEALSAPALPWKIRIALSFLIMVRNAARRRDGTINRRLLGFFERKVSSSPTIPINGVTSSDITVDATRNLWFRLYIPTSTAAAVSVPIIIFFHGGSYTYLSPDYKAYDDFGRRLAGGVQAVVISVNYRLAPEHKWPAQYKDGFDVLKFLDGELNPSRFLRENADFSRCFIVGDSAGGNLAHHVAKQWCESEFEKLKVIGVVPIQPFFYGEEKTDAEIRLAGIDPLLNRERLDWSVKCLLPSEEGMNKDHEVINVSGPNAADISKLNFPPVMVIVGGFDILQDWQMRYYEWLKRSGKEAYLVEFPNMIHAFYIFPEIPESAKLISVVKDFILKKCSESVET